MMLHATKSMLQWEFIPSRRYQLHKKPIIPHKDELMYERPKLHRIGTLFWGGGEHYVTLVGRETMSRCNQFPLLRP